tara:strand:+ start:29305 stop:29541 length:237 start_codon:yes stop_codon:yes gene_type:complete
MTDNVTSLTARRATLAEFDQHLVENIDSAIEYVDMGIDVAKNTRGIDPADLGDGLVLMRTVLMQSKDRLEKLSPYLGN